MLLIGLRKEKLLLMTTKRHSDVDETERAREANGMRREKRKTMICTARLHTLRFQNVVHADESP